jgi:hypothetical protein
MRKIHILGFALFAVLAVSAVAATSAFAEAEGQLLWNGAKLGATEELALEISGELLLEDMGATGMPDILCSGIFDALTLGPKLLDILQLLMLGGAALLADGTAGEPGVHIECEEMKNVCTNPVLLVALPFPWHVEIELMLVGGVSVYLAHFLTLLENEEALEEGNEPGYTVDCNSLLGLVEDTCNGLTSARVVTIGGALLMYFDSLALTEPWGAESESVNCSVGGAGQELIESHEDLEGEGGTITAVGGGTLTVSE